MTLWSELAPILSNGDSLTYDQSRALMRTIMAGELDDVKLSAFLSMVAVRGIDVTELRGLADHMQAAAEPIDLPSAVVDIVGTGGDGANTVNISTMAAIVIAASGCPVVKHGNRASTSACGSADLLEELGVDLSIDGSQITTAFADAGIAFLFANKFHPSMRHAARVRRGLGFPTAFNILGPLTNPVQPVASVVGVSRANAAPLVAGVFAERGANAFVFRGQEIGLDELSTVEPVRIWVVQGGEVTEVDRDPAALLGIPRADLHDLRGGSAAHNAAVAHQVLSEGEGPIADAVALNAALAIMAAAAAGVGTAEVRSAFDSTDWHNLETFTKGLLTGVEIARKTMRDGSARRTLETWVGATH